MKAQTHYTTPIAATPWMQRGRLALAALLVLLAGSLALMIALRPFPTFTAATPAASTRAAPISFCQACRDEWLAAMQPSHGTFAPAPVLPATRQHSALARVFRDEVLGANQASLSSITAAAGAGLEAQQEQLRQAGPR